jgi:hypothetical protein
MKQKSTKARSVAKPRKQHEYGWKEFFRDIARTAEQKFGPA